MHFFFVGCSKQNLKTVNLSNDCKLNYTIDGNRVVNIEIIQSGEKIILYLPKQNEMLFSLSDSDKKCNVILSDDFYTVEISNGPNNICRLNKNCNNSSFDFIVNDDYRTVVQYDINNKISEHYEILENKEYFYRVGEEGLLQKWFVCYIERQAPDMRFTKEIKRMVSETQSKRRKTEGYMLIQSLVALI